ncbi:MAG: peptidoglycan DD-metalloendopeptidase family protein [Oligoflexia bacterium]|nr:peptidoglycan DD-metalloendopeptidase family protein [Oligoflexia bacterium]
MIQKLSNKRLHLVVLIIVSAIGFGLGIYFGVAPSPKEDVSMQDLVPIDVEVEFPFQVKKNSTLFDTLLQLGFTGQDVHQLVQASKPHQNLNRILPTTRFALVDQNQDGKPEGLKFRFSAIDYLELTRTSTGAWVATPIQEKVETRMITFQGSVKSSLWESALEAQMDPALIVELTEIFAWQVDFNREVRQNDTWRLSVEQQVVKGHPAGWGRILAAEYMNDGRQYVGILFRHNGKDYGYFAPDGSSLRRMFLKSPMRFGRVSSRFSRNRFHPILKVGRPHLGVDYAAPVGTPIRTVGDGVVSFAGWSGGGGRVLKIRHNTTYETAYKHMSGFGPGIRVGARVSQGQIVGYVGSSGLSTGPHLHFEFYRNGSFVDPMSQKFPSSDPVPKELLPVFTGHVPVAVQTLPVGNSEATTGEREPSKN